MRDLLRASRVIRRVKERIEDDGRETIENKARRWQASRAPELPPELLAVADYDPAWPALFAREQARIRMALETLEAEPAVLGAVEHIGSTSIPGLAGKPMLDLLVSVTAPMHGKSKIDALAEIGYVLYGNSPCDRQASWLWKLGRGHALVIHLCELDNPWIATAVNFRDYMRAHPRDRAAYEACKRRLSADGGLTPLEYSMEKLILWSEISVKANAWAKRRNR